MRRTFTIVIESESHVRLSEAWGEVWNLANRMDAREGVVLHEVRREGREEEEEA